MTRSPPLTIDEECVAIIRAAAEPIAPHRRGRFYERIAELLYGVRPGSCARACKAAQAEFISAPPFPPRPMR